MARVVYTPLGLYRDATVVNAAYDAIETQTTNLTGPNFRREGLDARAFSSNTHGERWFAPVTTSTRFPVVGAGLGAGDWATLNLGVAPPFPIQVATPTVVPVGGVGRLRFRCQLVSDSTRKGVPLNGRIEFRLVRIDGTPTTTELPGSIREVACTGLVGATGIDACVATMGVITAQTVHTFVEVQFRATNAVTFQVSYACFSGHIFKRAEVL